MTRILFFDFVLEFFFVDKYTKIVYICGMYEVVVKKSVLKSVRKMPAQEQSRFQVLVDALKVSGPEQPSFKNYSKLGPDKFHCHLSYGWVACWTNENGTLKIEVYYAGSRESAPYAKH